MDSTSATSPSMRLPPLNALMCLRLFLGPALHVEHQLLQAPRHRLGAEVSLQVAPRRLALGPGLLPVRHHVAHQLAQVGQAGLGPARALKVGKEVGAVGLGLHKAVGLGRGAELGPSFLACREADPGRRGGQMLGPSGFACRA